jgi:hypothetical protein
MKANQAALEVGQLAWDMARGYATHITAIRMAPRLDPKAFVRLIGDYPSDFVQRKDGTKWSFGTQDALVDLADKTIAEELTRVLFAGSLLRLGDALKDHDYFEHAPLFELVRHLRNGIAHGNRFYILYPDELEKCPAHNRDADYRGPNRTMFEITAALNGQLVLFDFMGAGDVLDLLSSVGARLERMGRGEHGEIVSIKPLRERKTK